ncbi:MAG: hypothetical protein ACE14V_06195 [bacterium]
MKKLFTLVVIALCATSIGLAQSFWGSETKDVSLRLEGMSPDFAGLVDDEYTDFWINPADILNVKGGRLYTNLSNYINGAETQFGGASANEYLIGGVYSWENIGTFGAFFRNSYAEQEVGGVTVSEDKYWAIPLFYGRQINDALAFGLKLSYQTAETVGADEDLIWVVPAVKYAINPELTVGAIAKVGFYSADFGATDVDGTPWGLAVQGAYQLNDATKLRGFISYENLNIEDVDGDAWGIGVGSATKLNDKLLLALGIKYGNESIDEEPVLDEKDGVLSLPVGLEYTMTDWLTFRIGATHRIATVEDEIADTKDTNSETTYYYGAGLNITENLTVDVLGWKNLTELDNWRLSATVKF